MEGLASPVSALVDEGIGAADAPVDLGLLQAALARPLPLNHPRRAKVAEYESTEPVWKQQERKAVVKPPTTEPTGKGRGEGGVRGTSHRVYFA